MTFHPAENKKNAARLYAFLATYAHKLGGQGTVKHLPLADAIREYASQREQEKLADLLGPVRLAADQIPLICDWLESRSLFQPQALGIHQTYQFLQALTQMTDCGLIARVSNW